jgi:hypothetical protein
MKVAPNISFHDKVFRVQCAWRGKLAGRKMMAQRAAKQRLLEDGYARKLQCAYRARLARRRTAILKEEKRKLKV